MNERIKELADQAWQYADNNSRDGDRTHGWLYRDKFAELIVQECMNITSQCSGKIHPDDLNDLLKSHFGVE